MVNWNNSQILKIENKIHFHMVNLIQNLKIGLTGTAVTPAASLHPKRLWLTQLPQVNLSSTTS